jgi:hypothetical protein
MPVENICDERVNTLLRREGRSTGEAGQQREWKGERLNVLSNPDERHGVNGLVRSQMREFFI